MDKKQIDNRKITILYLTVTVLLTWFCQFMPILIGMDVENTSISSFDYSSVFFGFGGVMPTLIGVVFVFIYYTKEGVKDFLKRCFEDKKQKQSTYNAFVSHNAKIAQPFFKKYSDDKNIIGIGSFETSYGSLPVLPIAKTADITIDEKTYKFFGIELNNEISDDATIGEVSVILLFLNQIPVYV